MAGTTDKNTSVTNALIDALSPSKMSSGGSAAFFKGQDSSLLPAYIDDTSYAKGINVTTKRGCLSPRAGYIQRKFKLVNDGVFTDDRGNSTTFSKVFSGGKFQGACLYHTEMGERIVCVYSGLIYILNPGNFTAQYIEIDKERSRFTVVDERYEPYTQRLNQYARRVNFSQAGSYLVIFDYPDRPVILDGYKAYRSPVGETDVLGNPVYYVPATVLGCYNNNRLFVCSADNQFTAGDPVGSLVAPNAPVTFNELYQEAGEFRGQTFSLGNTNKNNPITAMGFLQTTDASTGIGPLYVATKDALYAYQTNLPRDAWTSATPFGTMILYNAGIVGPKAVDNVNSDLIFMSYDGHIRSFTVTKEYEKTWNHTPIDMEVWDWVKTDAGHLRDLSVVRYFGNRVFITVKPYRTQATDLGGNSVADYAFKGMVVLELDNMSGLNKAATPAWAGIWTGVDVMDLVNCGSEMFMFVKDPAYVNQIYTMDLEATQDFYDNKFKNIRSRIYTKQYGLESAYSDKKERSVIVGLQNLEGDVTLDLSRSNDYGEYGLWKHWEYSAPVCTPEEPVTLRPHFFRELNFGSPDETDCNPVTGEYGDVFRGVQFKLDIEAANWRLDYILAVSDKMTSDYTDTVCELESGRWDEAKCALTDLNLYHTAYYVEEE